MCSHTLTCFQHRNLYFYSRLGCVSFRWYFREGRRGSANMTAPELFCLCRIRWIFISNGGCYTMKTTTPMIPRCCLFWLRDPYRQIWHNVHVRSPTKWRLPWKEGLYLQRFWLHTGRQSDHIVCNIVSHIKLPPRKETTAKQLWWGRLGGGKKEKWDV